MTSYFFKQLDNQNNTEWLVDLIFVFTTVNCAVLVFTLFVGLAANVFVIWAVIRQKSLQTSNNALLVNLAIVDLIRCVVDCPLLISVELRGYGTGQSGVLLCDAQMVSFCFSCCVQLLTLASISAERYQAIANPFENKQRRIRIMVWIPLTWTVALFLSVLCMSRTRDSPVYMKCSGIHTESLSADDTFGRYILIPIWSGCFSVVLVFYGRIYWIVRTHNKKIFDKGVASPPKKLEIAVDGGETAEDKSNKLEYESKKTESGKAETQNDASSPAAAASKQSEATDTKYCSDRLQVETGKNTTPTVPVISMDATISCQKVITKNDCQPTPPSTKMENKNVSACKSFPSVKATKQPEGIETEERAAVREGPTETAKVTELAVPDISLDDTTSYTPSPEVVPENDCQPTPSSRKTVSFEANRSVHALLTDLESSTKMASDSKETFDVKADEVQPLPAAQPNSPAAQEDKEVAGAVCMMPSQLGKERASKKKEGKLAKRSGYIILTFVMFWTPLIVSILVNYFVHRHNTKSVWIALEVVIFSVSISCMTSATNPITYAAVNPQFRTEYRKLKAKCKRLDKLFKRSKR